MQADIPSGVSNLLPFFHAFTGADTVSSFGGIGKITAWKTWMSFRDVDTAFQEYSTMSQHLSQNSDNFLILQRFVVLMYHASSSAETVNEARRILFSQLNRPIESIPPTSDALFNHLKRAMLQCFVWTNCLTRESVSPDPCEWGWKKIGEIYEPVWSANADMTIDKLQELIACKCKLNCTRCRCVKTGLSCTLLCTCEGQCTTRHHIWMLYSSHFRVYYYIDQSVNASRSFLK